MTKIEGVYTSELLKDYLRRHYPDEIVMVVWNASDSVDEWNSLLEELGSGYLSSFPSNAPRLSHFCWR